MKLLDKHATEDFCIWCLQLFVMYNIRFSGISRSFFKNSESHVDKSGFLSLVRRINALGFESNSLHWRWAIFIFSHNLTQL